jgi:hypothetical protein
LCNVAPVQYPLSDLLHHLSPLLTGVYILENTPPIPPPPPTPGGGGGDKYGLRGKIFIKTKHAPTKKQKKKEGTGKWQNYKTRTMFYKIMGKNYRWEKIVVKKYN